MDYGMGKINIIDDCPECGGFFYSDGSTECDCEGLKNKKPIFGDEEIIRIHHVLQDFINGEPIEGKIRFHGEFCPDIRFRCLICQKILKIDLKGANSKIICCGIIYNKKYTYGNEIFYEAQDGQN